MHFETIRTERDQQIMTITIHRPDKLNALNQTVFKELAAALDALEKEADITSAVITGSGSKAFVAGADISEFNSLDQTAGTALSKSGQEVFNRIENSGKPIVAAVNGFALGGGCELAMACHFRVASDTARFGQPEVNLGLLPGYGGTQRLTQLIGKGRAMELLLTGKMIDAVTAFHYGLVNYVVPPSELMTQTFSILHLIQSKAPLALAATIKAVNLAFEPDQKGYETEANCFGELIITQDAQEGAAAFLEKRSPKFSGK